MLMLIIIETSASKQESKPAVKAYNDNAHPSKKVTAVEAYYSDSDVKCCHGLSAWLLYVPLDWLLESNDGRLAAGSIVVMGLRAIGFLIACDDSNNADVCKNSSLEEKSV